ncbi:MAG: class I tRNA ligase family protein, partial [Roseomonas sp.]
MKQTRYVTTPIYYVNDKPHVGHAYTSVAADVLARWWRLRGHEVFFLTGTDEHGQKVEKAARDAGMDPQAFTDQVSQHFRDLTSTLGLSNDDFIRTTEARHKAACSALWEELARRDEIYLGHYEGWYAVRDEAFYGPDELTERDGVKYAPSGAPVEWVREPSYFFRLSKWLPELLRRFDLPEGHAERIDVQPEARRNEVRAFVQQGLKDFADRPEKLDLSISRTSFTWGVKVPGDPAHVMYVWLDALTNYITAAGYPDPNAERWKFWPATAHFVGKDIVRFHTIYWPAFLLAAGIAPAKRVFAHGWWTIEGQKMSKSLGNVIDPVALVAEYGLDPLRYFLLREVPFGSDGDFSRKALANRLNGELADALGNLANRTLSLI